MIPFFKRSWSVATEICATGTVLSGMPVRPVRHDGADKPCSVETGCPAETKNCLSHFLTLSTHACYAGGLFGKIGSPSQVGDRATQWSNRPKQLIIPPTSLRIGSMPIDCATLINSASHRRQCRQQHTSTLAACVRADQVWERAFRAAVDVPLSANCCTERVCGTMAHRNTGSCQPPQMAGMLLSKRLGCSP